MNIGMLGSGEVAKALSRGFLKYNHSVMLGTRHPEKLGEWSSMNPDAKIGSFADAAAFGELIILAVKGSAASAVLHSAGAANLKGKTVMDATNPIADVPPVNGVLKFTTNLEQSLMEALQKEFPEARFVKAFNCVGHACMVDPKFKDGKPTMFICGNDAPAKRSVGKVAEQFGWEVADMGGAESARAIEPLSMLWCIPGFQRNDWNHAFKLLKQPAPMPNFPNSGEAAQRGGPTAFQWIKLW
jgi:predicted dinucleotide-binding enzyme